MAGLVVTCGTCGQRFKAPDRARGMRLPCSFCQSEILVDGDAIAEAAAPEPERPVRRETARRTAPPPAPEPEEESVPRPRGPAARPADGDLRESAVRRLRDAGMRESQVRRGASEGLRESGIRRQHGMGGKKDGLPLTWILGGAGGLAALLLIVVVVIVSGNNSRAAEEARRKVQEAKAAAEAKKKAEKERWESARADYKAAKDVAAAREDADRAQWESARAGGSERDFRSEEAAKKWCEAARAAERAKEDEARDRAWTRAIKLDPDNAEAHSALNHVKYQKPATEDVAKLDLEGLLDELDQNDGKWFAQKDYDALKAKEKKLLADGKAEIEKRQKDPYYSTIKQVLRNIASQPVLCDIKFTSQRKDPYLIFEQAHEALADPAAEKRLEEKVSMLKQLEAYFVREWATPFGLTRDTSEPLKVIVLRDRNAFAEYNKKMQSGLPPNVLAYYEPRNKWVILYNGILPGESREARTLNDGVVFHEGTHQLRDAYVNRTHLGGERIPCSRWFDEGLAEFIGSVEITKNLDGTRTYKPYARNDYRLEELANWRRPERGAQLKQMLDGIKQSFESQTGQKMPDFQLPPFRLTIEQMVQVYIYPDVARQLASSLEDPMQRQIVGMLLQTFGVQSLVYAQSVNFFYFCKNFEDGKYWAPLMRYLRWEWGLEGGAPTETEMMQAAGASMMGQDVDPNGNPLPGAKCLRAFRLAFDGIDIAKMEREYWTFLEPMIAEADRTRN